MALNQRIDHPAVKDKIPEAQRNLWDALHRFCRQHGAVVSLPGHKELRIEIPRDSTLPAELTRLGYSPHHFCAESRIRGGAFVTLDVISIMMPGK
jgi:hypothetical protein